MAAYNALIAHFHGLNAFSSLNASAITQAQQADQLRKGNVKKALPLLGIPISIKNEIAVANLGLDNSISIISLLGFMPTQNAKIVQSLIDAGAIIIGQNTTPDGANVTGINFQYGPILNAYDQTRISGGSSAGSSVAVAARIVPASVANDALGSVRIPEALNGIIGYRPSYGRYSSLANPDSLVGAANDPLGTLLTNGLSARSISDIVLMDQVIMGNNAVKVKESTKLKGLRLGVPASYYQNLDPALKVVVDKALQRLAKEGAILIHTPNIPGLDPGVTLPIGPLGNLQTFNDLVFDRAIMFLEDAYNFVVPLNIGLTAIFVSPDIVATRAIAEALVNGTFPNRAAKLFFNQTILLPLTNAAFTNYQSYFVNHHLDAIIYPTTIIPAKTIHDVIVNGGNPFTNGLFDFAITLPDTSVKSMTSAYTQNSGLSALFGTPSLSMPIGLTDDLHLPVGLQIEGLPGGDSSVLEIGSAFEKVFTIPAPAIADEDD